MPYPTLTERKRTKVARMEAAIETLAAKLGAYAREHGGRSVLFGSAARGKLRHDSDEKAHVAVEAAHELATQFRPALERFVTQIKS